MTQELNVADLELHSPDLISTAGSPSCTDDRRNLSPTSGGRVCPRATDPPSLSCTTPMPTGGRLHPLGSLQHLRRREDPRQHNIPRRPEDPPRRLRFLYRRPEPGEH
jgi:hypothetical protein